ncbi:MFS transporter [Sphingosinithalassobacter portus]|uniref:POT-type proton-dependent oligopeptide transporter n=1 Tax=Stakelama portus TaxID=2676234 RepID=UPI000D6E5D29|nr:MFS transporter [Sphingosinithalassobacter portus]
MVRADEPAKVRTGRAPPGFLPLAITEFWERFALAGVKSFLILTLIDDVLATDRGSVLGLSGIGRLLGGWFGPLTTAGLASQIYGITNALLYLAVPLGGLFGDYLGKRQYGVHLGALTMIAGLTAMFTRTLFLPGLMVFALGAGTLKGNLSVVVGALFTDDGARRRGFAVYLGFLNAGVICGPLVCGALTVFGGWRWGIAAAAVAVAAGLACALTATRLRAATGDSAGFTSLARTRSPTGHRANLPLLLLMLLSVFLAFGAYEQVGNMFLVWTRDQVDLRIAGWQIPLPWLLSIDGLFTLALIPLVQVALRALARRGLAIDDIGQMTLGCGSCALGNLVLAFGAWVQPGALPSIYPLAYLLCVDLAIVLVWPAGLSVVTRSAPARLVGFWVGLFYLHGFFANLWVGFSGAWYEAMPHADFWLMHAAIAAAGAAVALLARALPGRPARLRQEAITTSA